MLIPFPRIAHLQGSHMAPGDLLLDPAAQQLLLRSRVLVVEKLDGINVAIGRGRRGLQVAVREPWARALGGAVERAVDIYLRQRAGALEALLGPRDVLYAEWLWQRVSIRYRALRALLVAIALRRGTRWKSPPALRALAADAGLDAQPPLWEGVPGDLARLRSLIGPSRLGAPRMEGLVVRRLAPGAGPRWAKWVDARYRHVEPGHLRGDRNRLGSAASPRAR